MELLPFLPETGHEEEEDGEDFQTADEHVGAHEPFACCGHVGEVAGGACASGGGSYVTEHADAAAQGGIYVGS